MPHIGGAFSQFFSWKPHNIPVEALDSSILVKRHRSHLPRRIRSPGLLGFWKGEYIRRPHFNIGDVLTTKLYALQLACRQELCLGHDTASANVFFGLEFGDLPGHLTIILAYGCGRI